MASTYLSAQSTDRRGWLALTPWRDVFGIDLRTLGLFRIGLAVMILVDLMLRARDLRAHYTDFGVMPRDVLAQVLHPAAWSLHTASGGLWFQAALFSVAALFALMLLVGWRTRLASIASFLLLVSVQNRNPQILLGEDNLIVALTFWAMFLPLGARF